MKDNKKEISKAQQFLVDVGLFFDSSKLTVEPIEPAKTEVANILLFSTAIVSPMEVASYALSAHINNLIFKYGLTQVQAAFNKEIALIQIEKDMKGGSL